MNITVDTNPLLRFIVRDDQQQALAAQRAIRRAASVVIPLPCFCELIWVLRRVYGFARADLQAVLEELLEIPNVSVNRPSVLAGLEMLRAGGDFAEGVIAFEGRSFGGEVFPSFDRKAVRLVRAQGHRAELL